MPIYKHIEALNGYNIMARKWLNHTYKLEWMVDRFNYLKISVSVINFL